MHSTVTASVACPPTAPDSAVRVVYNAVRTLVPEHGIISLADLLAVVRLEPPVAASALDRLARDGPLTVHRLAGEDAWIVRRTDRW